MTRSSVVHRGLPERCFSKSQRRSFPFSDFYPSFHSPNQEPGQGDNLREKITQTKVQKTVEKATFEKFNQGNVGVLSVPD